MPAKSTTAKSRTAKSSAAKSTKKNNKWYYKVSQKLNQKVVAVVVIGLVATGGILSITLSSADALTWNTYANGLRQCESTNNYSAIGQATSSTPHYGAYQFSHSTWIGIGGGAYAYNANGASKSVQDYFAFKLYSSYGFGQWQCWTSNIYPTRTAWWGNPYHYSSTGSITTTPSTSTATSSNPYTAYCPTGSEQTVGYGYATFGNCVKKLQWDLNHIQGAGLAIDGSFGPATDAATKTYQSRHGLTADGVAGPRTWGSLDTYYR